MFYQQENPKDVVWQLHTGSGHDGGSKEVPEGVRVGRCI